MLRSGQKKIAKEPLHILDVNFDNIVISKIIERKTNSKYSIGYLDKVIRPLVQPKMSGYVNTFRFEDRTRKLMSFCREDEKLLEIYKTTWTKIENLKIFN